MMIIINTVEMLVAAAGILSSILLLYVSGTGEIEKVRHVMQSWEVLSKRFTMLAVLFSVISVVESVELLADLFALNLSEVIRAASLAVGAFAVVVLLSIARVLAYCKEEVLVFGSAVFYGKFGITLIYIAVIILSVVHIKFFVASSALSFVLNAVFLAFLPLFLYIVSRFRSYSRLIKRRDIVVLPHTADVFVGVAASFSLFFLSLAMRSIGDLVAYNLIEACSLLVFVLVSVSYGKEVEELIKAAGY